MNQQPLNPETEPQSLFSRVANLFVSSASSNSRANSQLSSNVDHQTQISKIIPKGTLEEISFESLEWEPDVDPENDEAQAM